MANVFKPQVGQDEVAEEEGSQNAKVAPLGQVDPGNKTGRIMSNDVE